MDNNDENISSDRGGTLVIPVISASSSFGGVLEVNRAHNSGGDRNG